MTGKPRFPPDDLRVDFGVERPGSANLMPEHVLDESTIRLLRRLKLNVHGPTHNCRFEDCQIPARGDPVSCAGYREFLEKLDA